MSPFSTFDAYIPSIASFFVRENVINNFKSASKSDSIKFAERGYKKIFSKMHPKSESRKMAFTLELVNFVEDAMRDFNRDHPDLWRVRAQEVALRVGIWFLLRKSEFLPSSRGSGLKRKCIIFFDISGFQIAYPNLRHGQANSVKIMIDFSKCDQLGIGRNLLHVRRPLAPKCIFADLESWMILTRDELQAGESDYLFKVQEKSLITSDHVTVIMKRTAEFCKLESHKISAHSLRYGGATMLAAAGLPQYIIAYFGGWTEDSESLKFYTQLNVSSNTIVSDIFANGNSRSLQEARIHNASRLHQKQNSLSGQD
jgi:hypothetical protein